MNDLCGIGCEYRTENIDACVCSGKMCCFFLSFSLHLNVANQREQRIVNVLQRKIRQLPIDIHGKIGFLGRINDEAYSNSLTFRHGIVVQTLFLVISSQNSESMTNNGFDVSLNYVKYYKFVETTNLRFLNDVRGVFLL